jgi:26S proteasome regulatory subunit N9
MTSAETSTTKMSTSSMAVDATSKPPKLDLDEFTSTALSATPVELHTYFDSFRFLHQRKYASFPFCSYTPIHSLLVSRLWHQLTLKLLEFFDNPLSKPFRLDVFERFVRDFEGKINPLRLVEMGVKVSKVIDSQSYPFYISII